MHPFLHSRAEEGHPEIVVLESNEKMPVVADGWHTDVTFSQTPPMASILRGVEVPEYGGDTMWASCTRAYDALSSTMKQLLADLTRDPRHLEDLLAQRLPEQEPSRRRQDPDARSTRSCARTPRPAARRSS